MKRRFVLGLLISGILLIVIFRQVDINQLYNELHALSYPLLLAAITCLLLTLIVRAWRWGYLMEPVKPTKMSNLFPATSIGAAMDMLLPVRMGDLIRAYLLSRKEDISSFACLGTIVVEKVFDLLVILVIGFVTIVAINFTAEKSSLPAKLPSTLYILAGLILVLSLLIWVSIVKTAWLNNFIQVRLTFLPVKMHTFLKRTLSSFIQGLQSFGRPDGLLQIIFLTCLLWGLFALSNLLILHAFGLSLPYYSALLILVFQILGVTVPSSPGFIGTYHAAVITGLSVFGISSEAAISVAIIMHAAFFFPFIFVGFIFIWKENLSLQALWYSRSSEPQSNKL